jgi:anthranilate synthase component 2
MNPDYLLISPGPGNPAQTGVSIPLIRIFMARIPVLGVCLGMQCINELLGGRTCRAPEPVHGKTSMVFHNGSGLFRGTYSPFRAARYHSLITDPVSENLAVAARTEDGVPMALNHPELPLFGLQFHPESFMTECGPLMIENFLSSGPAIVCPATGTGEYAQKN